MLFSINIGNTFLGEEGVKALITEVLSLEFYGVEYYKFG